MLALNARFRDFHRYCKFTDGDSSLNVRTIFGCRTLVNNINLTDTEGVVFAGQLSSSARFNCDGFIILQLLSLTDLVLAEITSLNETMTMTWYSFMRSVRYLS